ncbi:hypothetical protein KIN20_026937 [Parelaphostrongylus tenuis]|uniref:Uncharacterized protein n=1 Tax=Parelaphostrongylus tenuis TaxID=148309 RepID=A0AAD5WDM2_PARTN|nr:hypothetical protein KIN20_026937 [Parelaphostrongylus tenuis]
MAYPTGFINVELFVLTNLLQRQDKGGYAATRNLWLDPVPKNHTAMPAVSITWYIALVRNSCLLMDPSDSDERYLSGDSLELDVETALDVLSTYDYGLEAKKLIDQGESREGVETAEALLIGEAEPQTVTATSIESAQAMLEKGTEPLTTTARSVKVVQEMSKEGFEPLTATAGSAEAD